MSLLCLLRCARRTALLAPSAVTLSTVMLSTLLVTVAAPAEAAVPKVPVALPSSIEAMPVYQPQTFCDPVPKPGVAAFGELLTAAYPDTHIIDISRACASESGTSEHKDGRALDWAVNYNNPAQVKEVQAVLAWLFAKDAHGNPNAMLRRLGIMYVIWNKRIWGSWSQSWQPYACFGVTACHQDHVHFSFDWAGALKRTSFWTGTVSPRVAPPTYVYTNPAFAQVVAVAARSTTVTTPFLVRAGLRYRVTVTGTYHYAAHSTAVADAECSTLNGTTWSALAAGETSSGSGLLDLWVSNHRSWQPTVSTGGGCNKTSHTYTGTITFPVTGALRLAVDDPVRSDNSGTLRVTIQRV